MSAAAIEGGSGLFRPQALDAQRSSALGRIQVNTPLSHWLVTAVVSAFIAAFLTYLCLGHYTRRANVAGSLVPSAGLITLDASGFGRVVRVPVHQGERVRRGQILAEFDNPLDSAALGNTQDYITTQLKTERTGLEQDLQTQQALAASQMASLGASIDSLRAQAQQIRGQLALQRQEAASMQQLLTRITPLASKGDISAFDLQQQQANALNAQLQVKALRRQWLTTQQQLAQSEQQRAQIPLNLAAQQNDTRSKLAQISQALAQNEAQRAWVLRAPRGGVVSSLLLKAGQTVTSGQPLLSILPQGSTLEAQLLVSSASIGFVHPGQRVVLRYQAYPYQKFGLHAGVVQEVSRNALSPQEVTLLTGQQVGAPMYRIIVRPDAQHIEAYGHPAALMPGMALQADILLDRRRLIDWVLDPLYGFGRRLFGTTHPATFSGHIPARQEARA